VSNSNTFFLISQFGDEKQEEEKLNSEATQYMNTDILKGNWKQFRGEIQKKWGKLTNDDMDVINGEYNKLVGRVQERYGWDREHAEQEITNFFDREKA